MHPRDCPPSWEYKHHRYANAVGLRCEQLLNSLAKKEVPIDSSLRDTRSIHQRMFVNLTPDRCPYYAGHYRGEKLHCLRYLEVGIESDPRVGVPPARVAADLANLNSHVIASGLKALEASFSQPDATLPAEEKLFHLVVFACKVLAEFFRIHPYANGNGHIGRWIVWLIAVRFGYWPLKWELDTSPPYDALLKRFRDGDALPLQEFVLDSIIG